MSVVGVRADVRPTGARHGRPHFRQVACQPIRLPREMYCPRVPARGMNKRRGAARAAMPLLGGQPRPTPRPRGDSRTKDQRQHEPAEGECHECHGTRSDTGAAPRDSIEDDVGDSGHGQSQ